MDNFNPAYTGKRNDVLRLISDKAEKVLDIGCSTGTLGESIKQRRYVEVVGVELDEQMAKIARTRLDYVLLGDIEKINLEDHFLDGYFDCIIFADVLEHLKEPWEVLKNTTRVLNDGGVVIASIPNVRHYTTIIRLVLKGYWPYEERGIHDRNHLRFFTLKNIEEIFTKAKLGIIRIERNYRIGRLQKLCGFVKRLPLPSIRDFITFQYIVVARKSNYGGQEKCREQL